MTASASQIVSSTGDSINRDGRQNKKSKWDKVFMLENKFAASLTHFIVLTIF